MASKLKKCSKKPFPETVCFYPAMKRSIKDMPVNKTLWTIIRFLFFQILFRFTFGLRMIDLSPLDQPYFVKKILYYIVPEVQSMVHFFDKKKYRFLGSTVNQNFSDRRAKEEIFQKILKND